jgi:RHS repeat-associated protein
MKTKYPLFLLAIALALAVPFKAIAGSCTAARFNDWQDMGCLQQPGGNQSQCPTCCTCGMPRWSVSDPYLNVWLNDEPLSYKMSSGQDMAFRFYYRQRAQLPASDQIPTWYSCTRPARLEQQGYNPHVPTFSNLQIPTPNCGTNAYWGNNWQMSIVFWDYHWEHSWVIPNPINQYDAPSFAPFSDSYEAMIFNSNGGIYYFYNTNSQPYIQDPNSLVNLEPISSLGYPIGTNNPSIDANGIYWGDPGIGLKLVYSDGSQDVFGLTCCWPYTISYPAIPTSPTPDSTAQVLLTERIDPQGRITHVGYNTNFQVQFVVDPDGRTNTFIYNSSNQLTQIEDPYGRTVSASYDSKGQMTNLIDAAGNTNSFAYEPTNNGWLTNLTTPYGTTTFSYYQAMDPLTQPYGVSQRAVYISEPQGAQQFYFYGHKDDYLSMPAAETAPTDVPGQTYDNGNQGGPDESLYYRNSFHWARRQFAALSTNVLSQISAGAGAAAITNLTAADIRKSLVHHWLLSSNDGISVSDLISSERDPSPDAQGNITGARTWYRYFGQPTPGVSGSSEVASTARLLPDGSAQYTLYNYYPTNSPAAGLMSDYESSYSLLNGSIGQLTNWIDYGTNGVDVTCISNTAGQFTDYGYNTNHEITSITNTLGQLTTLTYDSSTYNLTGIDLPSGKTTTLNYYAQASPPTATSGMLEEIIGQPEGRTFTFNGYAAGYPSNIVDDRGVTESDTYDNLNRLTGTGFSDGTTISNIYTRLDLTATKDRLGHWTHYSYDGLQHLVALTNANNNVTLLSWCGCGSLESIIDALTNVTTFNYDNQGNLTNISFPDSSSLMYLYDLNQRMTNVVDGAGRSLQATYNNQGMVANLGNAYGILASITYDSANRPIIVTDANGVTVTNAYDGINELLTRTWQDGIGEGFGYSAAGLITYTNRDNQVTLYGLDGDGRIIAVTNANHEVVQASYDSLNNITNLIDGLNHPTKWQYNEFGWLTNKIDALGRNIAGYARNANGWMTSRTTPAKGTTTYGYDNVGNLTSITYPASSISYAYDADNRMTNMVDAFGTTAFAYTSAGQLQNETGPWASDALSYTYSQKLLTALSLSQPSGSWSQSYNYDLARRMTNVVSPAGKFVYSYNVQPASSLVSGISLTNGASVQNSYDSLGRITQTALVNQWGHTLDGYSYTLDALGLRTGITRNFGLATSSVAVNYDGIGQIMSWNASESRGLARMNEQLGFAYDTAHNLLSRTNNQLVETFTMDSANELTNVASSGTLTLNGAVFPSSTNITVNGRSAQIYGDFTYASTNLTLINGQNAFTNIAANAYGIKVTNTLTVNLPQTVQLLYDSNGNLTNDGLRSFAYDSENELTNVTVVGQWRSDFIYDGMWRRRIARDYSWNGTGWVLTNEVHYLYNGYQIVQERDTNNNPLVSYTRGLDLSGDLQHAGGIGGLLARTDGNGATYYHADANGNITSLMDGNENIVGRYLYNPFGKPLGQWGSLAGINEMQFSSMPQKDGLTLYMFRGYEANFQRWLNQDPIGERGGVNLYGFIGNNPVNLFDSFGLEEYSIVWGWSGSIGAGFLLGSGPFFSGSASGGIIVDASDIANSRLTGQVQGNVMGGIGIVATSGYGWSIGYNSGQPTQTGFVGTPFVHAEGGLQAGETPFTISGALDIDPKTLIGLLEPCHNLGINAGAGGDFKIKSGERGGAGLAAYVAAGGGYNYAYNTPTLRTMWNWIKSLF